MHTTVLEDNATLTLTPFGRDAMVKMSTEDFAVLKQKIDDAANDLKIKGYAVIPSLFDESECSEFKAMVWDFLDGLGLKEDFDYKSMKATDLPPHSHGIIHSYRINHALPFRELRKHPYVLAVHSRLNGSSCLTSSLDRVNIKFPNRPYKSQGSWAHVDQNPRNLGLRYVQSYVTFNACEEDSPQNRFYEGSHLIFEEFFQDRRTKKSGDAWVRLSAEDRQTVINKFNCPLVKPVCPAGSMILWDSRTIHDPDEGTNFEDGRLVAYLCYSKCFPTMGKVFKTKKSEAFSTCRATPHAPYPQTLFGKTVQTYGKSAGPYDVIPFSKLGHYPIDDAHDDDDDVKSEGRVVPDEWEKYLFCFKDYPSNNLDWLTKGAKMTNPLEKEWFGDHEVVPPNGKPLLPYVPFFTPLIPYDPPTSKGKNKESYTMKTTGKKETEAAKNLKRKAHNQCEKSARIIKRQKK